MKLRTMLIPLLATALSGCLTAYPVVKDTKSAAFIKFERNITEPLLGSITRYVNVDDKHQCRESYGDQKLLAVHNRGNPLVSDLNVDGLYVNSGKDFRILINTVAGGAWCDVIARMDVQAGQQYKIIVDGNVYIGVNKCSAKLYTLTGDASGKKTYVESKFKEYLECNK